MKVSKTTNICWKNFPSTKIKMLTL